MAWLLLVVAVSWAAQEGTDSDLARAVASPLTLKSYVDTHARLDWQDLQKVFGEEVGVLSCSGLGDCSAELVSVVEPAQTIFVLYAKGQSTLYVRYLGDERRGWRRAGVHVARLKNYPAGHVVERIGRRTILKVRSQGVSGSGVSSEQETWFDLGLNPLVPVFAFSPRGQQQRIWGISRSIRAVASPKIVNRREEIHLAVEVQLSGGDRALGVMRCEGVYVLDSVTRRFKLGEATWGSRALALQEFEQLVDLDEGPTGEQLAVYALPGLIEFARGNNADSKAWLLEMLSRMGDTRERQILLETKIPVP